MDEFERNLKRAMSRTEAPAWLEARVLAAAARQSERRRNWNVWPRRWATAALASVVLVGAVAWQHERSVEQRTAGEAARAKLELALKITRTKLRSIEQRIEAVEEGN